MVGRRRVRTKSLKPHPNCKTQPMENRYQVDPDVLFSNIDGEVIILSQQEESYLSLDPTGSRIWHLLADTLTLDQLVDLLTEEYEVSAEECRADVQDFLEDMVARGLIRHIPA